MAVFLTLPEGAGHCELFFLRYGRRWMRHMSDLTYAQLVKRGRVPSGTYIFCDVERMSSVQRRICALIWDQMLAGGTSVRLLNDPRRQLGRKLLLRKLYEDGVNTFNVWSIDEIGDQIRFPVFLRRENDHGGARSDLIYDLESLKHFAARLILGGVPSEAVLIVEFCDTSMDGIFRKYGAFRVGDRIFGNHVLLSKDWMAKREHRLRTPEALAENAAYFFENPHAELLRPFFDLAHIEFGRIDYSFLDGRIQVWEINDNPQFASSNPSFINKQGKEKTLAAALDALDEELVSASPVKLSVGPAIWSLLQEKEAAVPA